MVIIYEVKTDIEMNVARSRSLYFSLMRIKNYVSVYVLLLFWGVNSL